MTMKVRIVNYETSSWILSKFAVRLRDHLADFGVDVDLAQTPSRRADINHHVIYQNYDGRRNSIDTLMLTHFAFPKETELARVQLENAALGVCMSQPTFEFLVQAGFPRHKLIVAHPGHDGMISPRPVVLGLTTRVYQDGRKREHLLREVAPYLRPTSFHFRIMGDGWSEIVRDLRKRGFQVDYWKRFHFGQYCELMRSLDYYLYTGQDEGSMGFLDAVAAGIPTIVTPQGFHLDVPRGITHPFQTLDDLTSILTKIDSDRRERSNLLNTWTWENYAKTHLQAWSKLLDAPKLIGKGPDDCNVVRRIREINRGNSETLPKRWHRIMFSEGPIRVGCRVIKRWIESAS